MARKLERKALNKIFCKNKFYACQIEQLKKLFQFLVVSQNVRLIEKISLLPIKHDIIMSKLRTTRE